MRNRGERLARRSCAGCGVAAIVDLPRGVAYRCDACAGLPMDAQEVPAGGSRWLREGSATAAGALAALDEVFNPGATRAREQLRADHERQIPVPSPGDDLLRNGVVVIRRNVPNEDV